MAQLSPEIDTEKDRVSEKNHPCSSSSFLIEQNKNLLEEIRRLKAGANEFLQKENKALHEEVQKYKAEVAELESYKANALVASQRDNVDLKEKALRIKAHYSEAAKRKTQELEKEVKKLKADASRPLPQSLLTEAKKQLKPELFSVIENVLKNQKKKRRGHRYSMDIKKLSLMIYFLSPSAYQLLQNLFELPTHATLLKMTRTWPSRPGIDAQYFVVLRAKIAQLPEIARNCTICIDEMSLKTHLYYNRSLGEIIGLEDYGTERVNHIAKYALVVMAHGIAYDWRHVVGYVFTEKPCSAGKVCELLLEVVRMLLHVGIKPHALTTDQGANFCGLAKVLHVTAKNPTFTLAGQQMCYMWDSPHLIKSVRNNFLKYEFHFGEVNEQNVAKWSVVERFYKRDVERIYRLAPKLTSAHINPTSKEKMRVKYAVQVLSHTVSCALYTDYSLIQEEKQEVVRNTAEFLEKWDDIFDFFNSSCMHDIKKCKKGFKGTEGQLKFLEDSKKFIKSIRIKCAYTGRNVTKIVRCLNGWLTNIESLLRLWKSLQKEGFKYILTRRITQDCIEHFFSYIRRQGGNDRNPTPIQFSRAFKKIYGIHFLKNVKNANCEDQGALVLPIVPYSTPCNVAAFQTVDSLAIALPKDFRVADLGEENAFVYFCGYLLKKLKEKHDCPELNFGEDDINTVFINFKTYDQCELQHPAARFVEYIRQLENQFCEHFCELVTSKGLHHKLYDVMKEAKFAPCCENFDKSFLLNLFIRCRVYYLLKYHNQHLKETTNRPTTVTLLHM